MMTTKTRATPTTTRTLIETRGPSRSTGCTSRCSPVLKKDQTGYFGNRSSRNRGMNPVTRPARGRSAGHQGGSRGAERVDLVQSSDRSVARVNGWDSMDRFRSSARCSLRTCRRPSVLQPNSKVTWCNLIGRRIPLEPLSRICNALEARTIFSRRGKDRIA